MVDSGMLAAMMFGMVAAAAVMIGAVVIWGSLNGTLRESDQERFDRRFADIVRTEGYRR
jgi:hypothetical protein